MSDEKPTAAPANQSKTSFGDILKGLKSLFSCLKHGEDAYSHADKYIDQQQQQAQANAPQQPTTVRPVLFHRDVPWTNSCSRRLLKSTCL